MRTENLAIAFVDIAGFTERTANQSREDNERMLQRFGQVVRPSVKGFGGRVVKTIGDAFLLTFRSPTDALHCAMAICDRLARANVEVSEAERLDIRVAINAGDVRIERGDVFGEAVNIASRIESKTPAGEIYFSEVVYLAMTRAEVPSQEVGLTELKGIADEVKLFRVPRASEVGGYQLSGVETSVQVADSDSHELPYAGLGLSRLRSEGTLQSSKKVLDAVTPAARRAGSLATRGWRGFLTRFRGSRRFRLVSIGVLAVLVIAVVVMLAWPKPKPKPRTPWQKVKHELGF